MRTTGRLVRVGAFGASSLLLGLTAHLAGGGALPSVAVLLVVGLLLGLTAVVLTRRRLRGPVLLAALGVEQWALHLVFDLTSTAPRLGCGDPMAGMAHQGCLPGSTAPAMTSMSGAEHGLASGAGALMLITHALATLAIAWLLARGEAALWRVTDQLRAALVGPNARPGRRRIRPTSADPIRALISRTRVPAAPRGPPRIAGGSA